MHAKARRRSVAARSSAEAVPSTQTGRMLETSAQFLGPAEAGERKALGRRAGLGGAPRQRRYPERVPCRPDRGGGAVC